jgi:hypothetical protein
MKKTFICLAIAIALSNAQISCQHASARDPQDNVACGDFNCVAFDKTTREGIEWGIFYNSEGGQTGMQMFVVNLTKEKLEIELLKKQLAK